MRTTIKEFLFGPPRTWGRHLLDGLAFALCVVGLAWMFLWVLPAFIKAAEVAQP